MSDDDLAIAVAEACGWLYQPGEEPVYGGTYTPAGWRSPDGCFYSGGYGHKPIGLPKFASDLNAIVAAVQSQCATVQLRLVYYQNLVTLLDTNPDGSHRFGTCLYWETTQANARQRAEALLMTLI